MEGAAVANNTNTSADQNSETCSLPFINMSGCYKSGGGQTAGEKLLVKLSNQKYLHLPKGKSKTDSPIILFKCPTTRGLDVQYVLDNTVVHQGKMCKRTNSTLQS